MLTFLTLSNLTDRMLGMANGQAFFGTFRLDHIFVGATIWRGVYFMGIGVTIFLYQNSQRNHQRTIRLEKEASEKELTDRQLALELAAAKNAYLRAQINPHFMLSTLSYIHDSTRVSEPEAARAVLYISKLLRYALASERGPERVELQLEIEQVENLLYLTKTRKAQTYINFKYEQDVRKIEVIPFVLLSLAENMLKHGNLSVANNPGEINISFLNNSLIIQTSNLISSGINDTGFHTGLSSMKERLFLIYGSDSTILYGADENNYFKTQVSLPIPKNKDI